MTPPETYAVRPENSEPDSPGWSVRVIPNKFPFLSQQSSEAPDIRTLTSRPARGIHELLIESPGHNCSLANMDIQQAHLVLESLKKRYSYHQAEPTIKHICIFKNHGRGSGASLSHPHFQIAASDFVSPHISSKLSYRNDYAKTNGCSPFAQTIESEIAAETRIIAKNNHFIAFCPFASCTPFEVYIQPLSDEIDFGSISGDMTKDLTNMLQPILRQLEQGLGDPDYNIIFHTLPVGLSGDALKGNCFYLQIYPRLIRHGGYELATQTYVNHVDPEKAAEFYRNKS